MHFFIDFELPNASKILPKTLKKRKQKKQRKNEQKMSPQKPVSVREREARFISQTSRTSPSLWLYRSARCEASLSGHPYSSIAALARLRSRAALAKRLALGYRVSLRFLRIR